MSNEQNKAQIFVSELWNWLDSYTKNPHIIASVKVDNGVVRVTFSDGSVADFTEPLENLGGPDTKRFHVPVLYKGLRNFLIQAQNAEAADAAARRVFESGDRGITLGNEWEHVDAVYEPHEVESRGTTRTDTKNDELRRCYGGTPVDPQPRRDEGTIWDGCDKPGEHQASVSVDPHPRRVLNRLDELDAIGKDGKPVGDPIEFDKKGNPIV